MDYHELKMLIYQTKEADKNGMFGDAHENYLKIAKYCAARARICAAAHENQIRDGLSKKKKLP